MLKKLTEPVQVTEWYSLLRMRQHDNRDPSLGPVESSERLAVLELSGVAHTFSVHNDSTSIWTLYFRIGFLRQTSRALRFQDALSISKT